MACSDALGQVQIYHPMDRSPPGSSVRGVLQATILEWVAISSSSGSSLPKDQTHLLRLLHWQTLSHLGIPKDVAVVLY